MKLAWTIKVSFGRQVEGESDFIGKFSKILDSVGVFIGLLRPIFLCVFDHKPLAAIKLFFYKK